VDYRIRGYRPPKSVITAELSDDNLQFYNFDWLASSKSSLRSGRPYMSGGISKIPICFDDFPLYRGNLTYPEWEKRVLSLIDRNEFTAIGLHDCYGEFWLPSYRRFLDRVMSMGTVRTFDEVADDLFLQSCV
jgi:hypothetical protein